MAQGDGLGAICLRHTLRRDFLAVDRNLAGGFDSNTDLIPVNLDDGNDDVVADDDFLRPASC